MEVDVAPAEDEGYNTTARRTASAMPSTVTTHAEAQLQQQHQQLGMQPSSEVAAGVAATNQQMLQILGDHPVASASQERHQPLLEQRQREDEREERGPAQPNVTCPRRLAQRAAGTAQQCVGTARQCVRTARQCVGRYYPRRRCRRRRTSTTPDARQVRRSSTWPPVAGPRAAQHGQELVNTALSQLAEVVTEASSYQQIVANGLQIYTQLAGYDVAGLENWQEGSWKSWKNPSGRARRPLGPRARSASTGRVPPRGSSSQRGSRSPGRDELQPRITRRTSSSHSPSALRTVPTTPHTKSPLGVLGQQLAVQHQARVERGISTATVSSIGGGALTPRAGGEQTTPRVVEEGRFCFSMPGLLHDQAVATSTQELGTSSEDQDQQLHQPQPKKAVRQSSVLEPLPLPVRSSYTPPASRATSEAEFRTPEHGNTPPPELQEDINDHPARPPSLLSPRTIRRTPSADSSSRFSTSGGLSGTELETPASVRRERLDTVAPLRQFPPAHGPPPVDSWGSSSSGSSSAAGFITQGCRIDFLDSDTFSLADTMIPPDPESLSRNTSLEGGVPSRLPSATLSAPRDSPQSLWGSPGFSFPTHSGETRADSDSPTARTPSIPEVEPRAGAGSSLRKATMSWFEKKLQEAAGLVGGAWSTSNAPSTDVEGMNYGTGSWRSMASASTAAGAGGSSFSDAEDHQHGWSFSSSRGGRGPAILAPPSPTDSSFRVLPDSNSPAGGSSPPAGGGSFDLSSVVQPPASKSKGKTKSRNRTRSGSPASSSPSAAHLDRRLLGTSAPPAPPQSPRQEPASGSTDPSSPHSDSVPDARARSTPVEDEHHSGAASSGGVTYYRRRAVEISISYHGRKC
ncbi:unnamed protein product [Amoebophrya sp. A120]|nr:unnamed protein product [Amoebophrya sp. A120]|eukprot:GSA120T00019638001.1